MRIYNKILKFVMAISVFSIIFSAVPICSNFILQAVAQTTESVKVPAFDGAEGGGMWTSGARAAENPEVYHVTNLNDSGEGSFRDAVSKGNRFVVFDVGGNIKLKTPISSKNVSNLTILGQTAPGGGISIEGEQVYFSTSSNIIMRYLRIRMASTTREQSTIVFRDCDNIMVDHCSFSWSVDQCADLYGVKNATIQWCIVSEALHHSVHSEGAHSMGAMWGGINMTAHHNLLASNHSRNPMIPTGASTTTYYNASDTDSIVNIRNNVIYNWGGEGYGAQNGTRVNFIGNYYRPGPGTRESSKKLMFNIMGTHDSSKSLPENGGTCGGGKGRRGWSAVMYLEDNYMEGADEVNADNWKGIKIDSTVGSWDGAYIKCKDITDGIYVDGVLRPNNEYLSEYPIITQKPQSAYSEILKYAGASDRRDSIDTRVINDVINKTAPTGKISGLGFIDSPDDVGGFITLDGGVKPLDTDNDGLPDEWEEKNGLDKTNPTDAITINADGYTMLEEYGEELINGENKPADKSELRQTIYSALNLNKYDYSLKSWNDMQAVLNDAKEAVSVVYPNQADIDAACENLKNAIDALKPEKKYDLRIETENAKELDSQMYLMDSYEALTTALEKAEAVYSDDNSSKADVEAALQSLKDAVQRLEIDYRYTLNQLIEKADNEDQVSYTIQSMTNLIEKNNAAKEAIKDSNTANDALKEKYDALKSAHDLLETETDVYSRFTGDFENLLCYKVKSGYYGKYFLKAGNAPCEVKQNIGGNSSKSLVINDNISNRTSIVHRLNKKLEGLVSVEGDYYFEDEPKSYNILLELSDSDLTDNNAGVFLDLNTIKSGSDICLQVDNSGTVATLSNVTFKQGQWYNIKVLTDTLKKDYIIYINGEQVQSGHITAPAAEKSGFGVISYQIATTGGQTQILALDNIKTEVEGNNDKLKELIDKTKAIDSSMYTEESGAKLTSCLTLAEKRYNSSFIQGDDIQLSIDALSEAIDSLERKGVGHELNELVNTASAINQMEYTFESVETLAASIKSAKEKLADINSSNEDLMSEYEKLNAAYTALVAGVDNSKLSGDFERLSCIGIGDGKYGRFRTKILDNVCEVKENVGDNPTKVLWFHNTSTANRALIEYSLVDKFTNKVSGVISVEGDYYFENRPTGATILLRLVDNNFDGSILEFLNITPVIINTNACLRVNCMNTDINDFANVVFEVGKWYNIKATLDTIKKTYSVYVNGKEIISTPINGLPSNSELGLSRYVIATAGKNIMAIDNIKADIINEGCKLADYEFSGEWTAASEITFSGDIVNYENESEDLLLIAASYENGILIDSEIKNLSVNGFSSADNITTKVRLGNDIENCEVKVFLWRNGNLKPLTAVEAKQQ